MIRKIAGLIIIIAALIITMTTARYYATPNNAGMAWDWGGVEVIGEPGLFLCSTSQDWNNPLASLFPNLVTDC